MILAEQHEVWVTVPVFIGKLGDTSWALPAPGDYVTDSAGKNRLMVLRTFGHQYSVAAREGALAARPGYQDLLLV
jgi:hypothetical protein